MNSDIAMDDKQAVVVTSSVLRASAVFIDRLTTPRHARPRRAQAVLGWCWGLFSADKRLFNEVSKFAVDPRERRHSSLTVVIEPSLARSLDRSLE